MNLLAPKMPRDEEYYPIIKVLNKHFLESFSSLSSALSFTQECVSESGSDFIASLGKLADSCYFQAAVEDIIRDQLVCCINYDLMHPQHLEIRNSLFQRWSRLSFLWCQVRDMPKKSRSRWERRQLQRLTVCLCRLPGNLNIVPKYYTAYLTEKTRKTETINN